MQSRKFVALLPSEKTQIRLQRLADSLGLDTSKDHSGNLVDHFEFHMTLLYSIDECDYPSFEFPTFHPITVNGACLCQLGDRATVIRTTTSKPLTQLRDQIVRDLKVTHSHQEWIPHVSLSYVLNPDLELPKNFWYKPLTFNRIAVRSADD